ncbi:MAG TPA: hypothetical protein VLN49_14895 [Gemmatimonadaceae bacterium]|nr:hypothetical protein [Gemmatimonadaceae bacterium]
MPTRLRAGSHARFWCLITVSSLIALAAPASTVRAQGTMTFDHGIVASGDWLQANALPIDRSTLHSNAANLSFRRGSWSADVGWLRVARDLSTVQGGTVSFGWLLPIGRVLFIPALGALGGRAQASVDSTGFDWVDPQTGAKGHTPRYSYSSASTIGGSVGLTVEVPLFGPVAARGVASQWYFSGTPLEGDRARTVLGGGLSVRLGGGR